MAVEEGRRGRIEKREQRNTCAELINDECCRLERRELVAKDGYVKDEVDLSEDRTENGELAEEMRWNEGFMCTNVEGTLMIISYCLVGQDCEQ